MLQWEIYFSAITINESFYLSVNRHPNHMGFVDTHLILIAQFDMHYEPFLLQSRMFYPNRRIYVWYFPLLHGEWVPVGIKVGLFIYWWCLLWCSREKLKTKIYYCTPGSCMITTESSIYKFSTNRIPKYFPSFFVLHTGELTLVPILYKSLETLYTLL